MINYSPNHFKQKSIKTSLTASIVAGLVSGSVSHPFDTIKTYTQSHVNKKPKPLINNAITLDYSQGIETILNFKDSRN